jgi:glycosyltransferase involved in cell wall biosynthesis
MINIIKNTLINIRRRYKFYQLENYYKIDASSFLEKLKRERSRDTLIITIAFNNEQVIEKQIELLSEFCKDNYMYIVADNSTNKQKSLAIEKICNKHSIFYYRLPELNPFNGYDPSSSHGASLNYIWRNIISKLDSVKYLMLLDHDIFPTNSFSVKEMLGNQDFYGLVKIRELGWYLWPGFSCFLREYLLNREVNFLPSKYGDTGSSNYLSIYKYYDLNKIVQATNEYVNLDITDINEKDTYIDQKNRLELMDGHWIHLINAADWAGIGNMDKKFNKMLQFINEKVGK